MIGVSLSLGDVAVLGGGSAGAGLSAPSLSITSGTTVNTPTFSITYPDIVVVGDVMTLQQDTSSAFASPTTYTHTITNADVLAGSFSFGNSALPDGTYFFRTKQTRGGVDQTLWSNTTTIAIDAPPTLTSPTAVQTGQTTGTIGVTTDQGNGTLFWVVTTSSTAPSVAQIKAGQDNSGAAAAASGSQAVSASGAQSHNVTGLSAGTTYNAFFVHTDAGSNNSNIPSGVNFTTASSATKNFIIALRSQAGSATQAQFTGINLGPASPDRLVGVCLSHQKGSTLTSVTVDGTVTLTKDVGAIQDNNSFVYSGLVPSGSGTHTIEVNNSAGAAFNNRDIAVFTFTGLNSNTVKHTAANPSSASLTINVSAGDFLLASCDTNSGAGTFAGSTQSPDAARFVPGAPAGGLSADWTIAATNASFTVNQALGSNPGFCAATYR